MFSIFIILGLQGIYNLQSAAGGLIALISHILLMAGIAYFFGLGVIRMLYPERYKQIGEQSQLLNLLNTLLIIGLIGSGYAIIHTEVFPFWSGVLMLITGILDFFIQRSPISFYFPLAFTFVWIGFYIFTH